MSGPPGPAAIRRWRFGEPVEPLAERLARGGILAIPTESSYGLGVDPRNPAGVAAIYRLKGRDRGKALPVVAADLAQLAVLGIDVESPLLRQLSRHWPAPLSCILPLAAPLPAAAGEGSLAVRVPAHASLRGLLADLGTPLTATSANRSGEPPALTAEAVAEIFAAALEGGALAPEPGAVVVDGGALPGGLPSTLVRLAGGELEVLREGSFPAHRIVEKSGEP